jgi:hypothetical protein
MPCGGRVKGHRGPSARAYAAGPVSLARGHGTRPDYERALMYAALSLRDAVNELAHQITLASRH